MFYVQLEKKTFFRSLWIPSLETMFLEEYRRSAHGMSMNLLWGEPVWDSRWSGTCNTPSERDKAKKNLLNQFEWDLLWFLFNINFAFHLPLSRAFLSTPSAESALFLPFSLKTFHLSLQCCFSELDVASLHIYYFLAYFRRLASATSRANWDVEAVSAIATVASQRRSRERIVWILVNLLAMWYIVGIQTWYFVWVSAQFYFLQRIFPSPTVGSDIVTSNFSENWQIAIAIELQRGTSLVNMASAKQSSGKINKFSSALRSSRSSPGRGKRFPSKESPKGRGNAQQVFHYQTSRRGTKILRRITLGCYSITRELVNWITVVSILFVALTWK